MVVSLFRVGPTHNLRTYGALLFSSLLSLSPLSTSSPSSPSSSYSPVVFVVLNRAEPRSGLARRNAPWRLSLARRYRDWFSFIAVPLHTSDTGACVVPVQRV